MHYHRGWDEAIPLYPASSDFTFSGRFHDTGICMGVLRNHGMLVTTETRSGAQSPAKDMGEMVQRLTQARAQHEDTAQLAQQHNAQSSDASQHDAAKAIKAQNDAIRGDTARWRENPFPEMTRPDLVVASAAGIGMTAALGTHVVSGQDHAVTAGRDVSVSSGRSLFASVRGAISMFAYQLGLKRVAAKGKVDIQAQSDQIALAALKDITITSTDGKIAITASKEIWIGAGGSYIQINASGMSARHESPPPQRFARSEVLESFHAHARVGTHKTSHPFVQNGTPDHAAARASVIIQSPAYRGPAMRARAASQAQPDCCRQDDHESSPC
ncbi:putative type VI secretion system Rhs element Vgr protein [Paraburkholderia sp. BL6665CI2N2]|nr:putative type VI secretion system Rhs element Vgr protein [Paraburkholderia sp. BL6665CI2N2]